MARAPLSIEKVQHWVVTLLITAVATFPTGALTAYIVTLRPDRHADAIELCLMMAAIGMLAMAAIRLVHRLPPVSPWLLIGAIPATIVAIIAL